MRRNPKPARRPCTSQVDPHRARSIATWDQLEPRQLLAATATPFPEVTPSLPEATVLFVNYDNGGEGVGYRDVDRSNKGGEYRRKDGVDVEWIDDSRSRNLYGAPGVDRGVSYVNAGEWLSYTINVSTVGTYRFDLRYATATLGGTAHLEIDGKDVTGALDMTSTAGWDKWRTLQKSGVALSEGQHTIRFVIDSGAGNVANLHWFRFVAEGSKTPVSSAGKAQSEVPWPDSWKQIKGAPSPRFEAMSHVFGDNIYVFGGFKNSDFEVDRSYAIFNPEKNTWKTLGNLPKGMAETHIVPVDDGKFIYFAGGFAGDHRKGVRPSQVASDGVWRYEPAKNRWVELPSLPRPQGAGGSAIVAGKMHFFGGNFEDRVANVGNHLVMDLSRTSAGWGTARSMPDPKDHFSTVALNGKIYTIGGEYDHDDRFDTQNSVHVYIPKTDKWKRLAYLPMPVGHAEGSTFVHNGQIVIAGGQTRDQAATNRVFAYNLSSDSWSELNSLPNFLQGASVAAIGDKVFVTQGARYTVQPLADSYVGLI